MANKKPADVVIEDPDFSGKILPNGRVYDFASLPMGGGFFCATLGDAKSVISSSYYYAKKNPGFKMARRHVHGGYKVWRIS